MSGDKGEGDVNVWLRYAEEDLDAASAAMGKPGFVPRHVCFLAQQSAEKAIKAALTFAGIEFPFRHNLNALRNMLPNGWQIKHEPPDLASLTLWAIEARYPSDLPEPTDQDARDAIEQARAVLDKVRHDLARHGFKP